MPVSLGELSGLATAMLDRMQGLAASGGTIAAVTPQNWLFLGSYKKLREELLARVSMTVLTVLGEHGFDSSAAAGAFTALIALTATRPIETTVFAGLDANRGADPGAKATILSKDEIQIVKQSIQNRNPDSRIILGEISNLPLLADFAGCYVGFQNGDSPRWVQQFWEQTQATDRWTYLQMPVDDASEFGGRNSILLWEDGAGALSTSDGVFVKGREAWGRQGVMVRQMRHLPVSLFDGNLYDQSGSVIVPFDEGNFPAVWMYCRSTFFNDAVRRIDRKINVTTATMTKIPFDLVYWQGEAAKCFPSGLPQPYSDDPIQWLFHGHPAFAIAGTELHVALARLAGYRWPAETDPAMRLSDLARERIAQAAVLPIADAEGLLLLHARGAKPSLADGLRAMLAASFGAALLPAQEQALVRAADMKLEKKEARDATLETWLRDRAFRQHYILFNQRPFLWQVWDGMQDGFSAFLHYHRLDNAALNTLTYTLLGDWIRTAKAEGNTARQERAEQLQQKLAKIIEGESPYDIFVRWKPLARQPLGWNPDLDDGVRLNIRPFMTAGILREQPKGIAWNKDRGTDVTSAPWYDLGPRYGGKPGDRINDHHTTLAEKQAARGTS